MSEVVILPIPVAFRDDPKFIYSTPRMKILFEEEKLFHAPPFVLHVPESHSKNMRSVLIKWLKEFHFSHDGGMETLAVTVNMLDRVMPVPNVYHEEPLLSLMACYTIASSLHDVLPVEASSFAKYMGRLELADLNQYTALLMASDLSYNTQGVNPIDFIRTFSHFLFPCVPPIDKLHQSTASNVNTSLALASSFASSSSSSSSSAASTSHQIVPPSALHPRGWSEDRMKFYREELLLKAVYNYNHSSHSNKLANFFASEIAAACLIWASRNVVTRINIMPRSFVTHVPLLSTMHIGELWMANVQAALKIVSKHSTSNFKNNSH